MVCKEGKDGLFRKGNRSKTEESRRNVKEKSSTQDIRQGKWEQCRRREVNSGERGREVKPQYGYLKRPQQKLLLITDLQTNNV